MYAILIESGLRILLLLHPKSFTNKIDRVLTSQNSIRSISAMWSILSHEIKNPLSSIYGAAQLLENENIANRKDLTKIIIEEAKRIEGVLDRVELLGEVNIKKFNHINIHDVFH